MIASRPVPISAKPSVRPSTISAVRTGLVFTVWMARDLKSAGRLKTASRSVTVQTRNAVAPRMNPR